MPYIIVCCIIYKTISNAETCSWHQVTAIKKEGTRSFSFRISARFVRLSLWLGGVQVLANIKPDLEVMGQELPARLKEMVRFTKLQERLNRTKSPQQSPLKILYLLHINIIYVLKTQRKIILSILSRTC
jgi:hypothetical protein